MRPLWKGHIRFGLVLIPVVLYSGEAPQAELDLDMLDERDQSRIRYQRVNEKTGEEVPWKSIVKGYQYTKGKYVILTPEDFKAAAEGATKGVDLLEFVPLDSIDPAYFEKPYVLEPSKDGEKGYVLLRETLKRMKLIGISRVVIQTREHLAALMPHDDALMLLTMRFPAELRGADDFKIPQGNSGAAKVQPAELKMAEMLVESMKTAWDPTRHQDRYRKSLEKFIKQKIAGKGKATPAVEEDADVPESFNIMDLLRKSVKGKGGESAEVAAPKRGGQSAAGPRARRVGRSHPPAKHGPRRRAG